MKNSADWGGCYPPRPCSAVWLIPEIIAKFRISAPFALAPKKACLAPPIVDGHVGFKGKAITAPSDLCSLEGGHAVEENKYLTNFVIDSYLELPQAARTDGVGSEVVVFP